MIVGSQPGLPVERRLELSKVIVEMIAGEDIQHVVVRRVLALVIGRIDVEHISLQSSDQGVGIFTVGPVSLRTLDYLGQGQPEGLLCRCLPALEIGSIGAGDVRHAVRRIDQRAQQEIELAPGKELLAISLAQEAENTIKPPTILVGKIAPVGGAARAIISINKPLHRLDAGIEIMHRPGKRQPSRRLPG